MTVLDSGLHFALPDSRVAHAPPEARGIERDDVRLLVSRTRGDDVSHARFRDLPELLSPGDLLVANASATYNAALEATRESGHGFDERSVLLHLSTPLEHGRWVVELRRRAPEGHAPLLDAEVGERLSLPGGATARLLRPYTRRGAHESHPRVRLWIAALALPDEVFPYTARHGSPIRYGYVPRPWPLSAYQTVFAAEPGSAEMPSAGRPFTSRLLARLRGAGIEVATLVLHTGVSSLDADEGPYPERFRVPRETADAVNRAHRRGGRVVAVGTTSVRALESVAREDGTVSAGEGWTDLVVTPERGLRTVDAILTGLHGPDASHLAMLEALAGRGHLLHAYDEALRRAYLWHEFGDSHLLLG